MTEAVQHLQRAGIQTAFTCFFSAAVLTMLITDRLMQQWLTSTSLRDLAISATIGACVVGNILMAGFRLRRAAIATRNMPNH